MAEIRISSEENKKKQGKPEGKVKEYQDVSQLVTEYKTSREKLDSLVKRTSRVLFKCTSVFPFDFFPNSVIIDENKVDIVYRNFFYSEHVVSILIPNINFVEAECSLIFGTLTLEVSGFEQNPLPVSYLWKRDAIKARRMIMGLVACAKKDIDLADFDIQELQKKIEMIGIARGG